MYESVNENNPKQAGMLSPGISADTEVKRPTLWHLPCKRPIQLYSSHATMIRQESVEQTDELWTLREKTTLNLVLTR